MGRPQNVSSRSAAAPAGRVLSRADLAGHPAVVLKDEGHGGAAVVRRVDLPDGPVVAKEWAPTGSRLLSFWARHSMRREIRHYRLLDGVSGVPRLRGFEADRLLILQYVEGRPIHRHLPTELLTAGLDSLARTLEALHERRFVHLDLHQKLNAIIDASGRAWVIDLGQGLDCSRGLLRRLCFPLLVRIDRNAVLKFRARYAPQTLDPEQRARLVARFGARREWWPKSLGRRLRQLVTGQR